MVALRENAPLTGRYARAARTRQPKTAGSFFRLRIRDHTVAPSRKIPASVWSSRQAAPRTLASLEPNGCDSTSRSIWRFAGNRIRLVDSAKARATIIGLTSNGGGGRGGGGGEKAGGGRKPRGGGAREKRGTAAGGGRSPHTFEHPKAGPQDGQKHTGVLGD